MCLRETSSGDSDDSCNHAKLYQQFILRTIMTRIVVSTILVTMVCYVMTMYCITPKRGHVILFAAPVFYLPLCLDTLDISLHDNGQPRPDMFVC